MIKLLVIEDEPNLRYILLNELQMLNKEYEIVTAGNGKEGLEKWKECRPDIILSDIDMPVMDGFEMVKRIRETDGDTPILFASALTAARDVVKGFDIGADNYVKKPYIPEEVDAHIRALIKMKRGDKSRDESSLRKIGNYVLDAEHGNLRNTATGEMKMLPPTKAKVLQILADNKNDIVRREAIIEQCLNREPDYYSSRSLDVMVSELRKLLSDDPQIEIRTIRGVGLMLADTGR